LNNGIPEQSMIYDGEFINPEELFESWKSKILRPKGWNEN
jgi:hypothetical protein